MPATHALSFDGHILRRGFWLYIWEITPPEGTSIHYVGRTGDSSSANAQSPFNRVSQHLGFNEKSNALRRHLEERGLRPEECRFRLVTHGPVLEEAQTAEEHHVPRDAVAALEKALAEALCAAGYDVINRVACRKPLDAARFEEIRAAFAVHFPRL
jgi:hypothetical protein